MSWPHCTKTHKLVRVLGNGPFPGQGPVGEAHGAGSPTQQYNFFAEQTLKISVYFMQQIKSYSIFTVRQTDRHTDRQTHRQTDTQTDRHTDRRTFCIPICTGEIFFYMEIYTFQNTTWVSELRSLTHSLRLWRITFLINFGSQYLKQILSHCNSALWLDVASHMTSFNQLDCFFYTV